MPVDKSVMQSLPGLLRNCAIKFLDCDSATYSVRFSGQPKGHLASVFAALLPIYKTHASDEDICQLLEVFVCDEVQAHKGHSPPVVQAYAMEIVREILQVKICEVEELTHVKRLSDSLFSRFYFVNEWAATDQLHTDVQEEANTNHHGNIRLLLQCPAALSVLAALEASFELFDQLYVQRLFSFLNYFLSQTSYFISAAKRGDFIVKLANAADKERVGLQVLGLCLQKPDLANELDKVRDLYLRLLRSDEHFAFAISDLTRVFRMMDLNSRIFEDFETVFKETEDPERLNLMAECISGVIDTCEKQATKQKLQDTYIISLPVAVLQAHWKTRNPILTKTLNMLVRSILNNNRNKQEQVKQLTQALIRFLSANREATASFLEDLLITIFGSESIETTKEVELPELIDCFLELIKSSRDDDLVKRILAHLQELMVKSLYNISCFSKYGGKLLELAEQEGRRKDSLDLLKLCGSYYVWPSILRKFLDKLYESLITGDQEFTVSLLEALIPMSRNERRIFKHTSKSKRPMPFQSLHFGNIDSVYSSSLLAFFDKGLTITFWIFPQVPGTVITILDDSLKIVLTIDQGNKLEVLVVKSGLAVNFPNFAEVQLNEWNFISFTITDRYVSLHVNFKTYSAEEVRCNFEDILTVNIGSCYARSSFMHSFIGEITNLLVLKGNVTEDILTSLYYNGFDSLNFLPQFKYEAVWYEEFPDQTRHNLELVKSFVTHFLDLTGQVPKLNSVDAVLLQDLDRNPRVTISNVKICGGPNLLDAFHHIGGLKVWLFLMNEISRTARSSSLQVPIIETYRLLTNLLEQANFKTCLEVCRDNLFDMICSQLKRWKNKGIGGIEAFRVTVKGAEIAWLYKKCVNSVDRETEATMQSYRKHPGALRAALSFKLWREIDQCQFFEEVTSLSEKLSDFECNIAMHMHLLDYYMSLARHSNLSLENLKLKYQDKFFKTLRADMNLRSLLMLLLYERSKSLSTAAIQLVLELTGSFAMSEFSDYISRSDKRLRSLLKNIYDLTVMLSVSQGTSDCLRYVGFTVEKLFSLKVIVVSTYNRVEQEVPALSLCEELVLKLAEVSSQQDTVRLIEHFVDQCQAMKIPYDFGRLIKIYFVCWTKTKDMETLRFAADVLDQQFTQGSFERSYERLYVTCEETLKTRPEFQDFLINLMLCLANSEVASTAFRLLIYWAEDLQKHLKVRIPVELLKRLLELAVLEGVQHDIEPFIPRFSWVSPILVETEKPRVNSFSRREGGVIRILLSMPLRAMMTENPIECVELIRELLELRIPESYLRFKFVGATDNSANFFAEDLNITAYAAGEILELLSVRPELRIPEIYSLALDLILANGNNLFNCVDLLSNADVKFNEFLLANFAKVSASVSQYQRTVLLYPVSRNPITREEKSVLMGLESKLKEMARKKLYDVFEEQLLDRSSNLARLHDFLVSYSCMKIKAIEQVKPTYLVSSIKTPKFYSKKYLPTANEQATEQLFYEKTRHNKNMTDYGTTRLMTLLRKLTLEFQLNSSYYTPQFWKVSPVVDALGRKMRLVPNSKGSNYHDKVNSMYVEATPADKTSINVDDILSANLKPPSLIGSILNRRSSTPFMERPEMANSLYIERLEIASNPHAPADNLAPSVTLDCENVRLECSVFGELEVSADSLVFRASGKSRPEKYDLASLKSSMQQRRYVKIWLSREITEVVHKKYMQQRTAIEVYTTSGRSYLFNLYSIISIRKIVHFFGDKFKTSTSESIAPWTKLWKSGQISNLEYLMKLNRYSGRSYNDLGQYPVFPWVLSNYSETLSFEESEFRDLSWPIGAIDERSRNESIERFAQFEGDIDLMPYHYGSHYSNMGITVHYLIRAEPYTKQAISFQDNHFDVADRLFYSIKIAWENSTLATGDYKELIPEFFAFPEFLLNMHKYNLGWRQSGEEVDDVALPAWSEPGESMSPYSFIYMHRRALEHNFVSRNLNKWIDLIFGCKHEDKASVNVFLPLTYEHHFTEQLAMCDAEKFARETLLIQIAHFGQTPSRLFDRPHEPRMFERKEGPLFKDFDVSTVTEEGNVNKIRRSTSALSVMGSSRETAIVILIMRRKSGSCVIFEQDNKLYALFFEENQPEWLKQLSNLTGGCEIEKFSSSPSQTLESCFALTDSKCLIACRYTDSTFRFYSYNSKTNKVSLKESIYFHNALVACLDFSDDDLLVTADNEGVIAVWEVDFRGSQLCTLRGILRSQSVGIKQVTINQPLQLILSLDHEGCIFVHDSRSCELVNLLRPDCIPNCVAISSLGIIAVGAQEDLPKIQLYSLSGRQCRGSLKTISGIQSTRYLEARREHGIDMDEIKRIQFNSAGDYLMTAGTSTFCIWPVYEGKAPYIYGGNALVRAYAIDADERTVLLHPQRRDFVLVKRSISS
eukprot:CAMPEP_0204897634 /NCGR_PEP_ID=MMETSP1397-20131031/848_1 /ASSEMBLY_ACC=CAM_ASM_000891 /TAXON_ID=49980 /ORGANISM="Climacostomum Climacostomum virens, Strain Stock W-24" /LENGTH=2393 /DNA_ID=CAMNT_0052065411 /DNA_START=106 /DNA_END=7287 /DNA_ORIENTATION=+